MTLFAFIFFVTAASFGALIYLSMRAWKKGHTTLARWIVTIVIIGYVFFSFYVLRVYSVI